jgi:ADP-ribose pyrophosphatase YjhB (NUDIX family)
MSRVKLFCSNCGKYNHVYNQCIEPITSIGVICVRYNQDIKEFEYLLICRKDTLGFIDFMRGKYSYSNLPHLKNVIYEMTNCEKERILNNDFDTLWSQLWHDNYGIKYRNEAKYSKEKFDKLKEGILLKKDIVTLQSLVENSESSWIDAEWEIPKGRRNYKERDIDTALREFEEETGIDKENIHIAQNITPYDEVFTGSNFKSYRQRYFVGFPKKKVTLENFQTCEVSKIEWVPFSKLPKFVRKYSLEKLEILKNVNKVLETYRIIF